MTPQNDARRTARNPGLVPVFLPPPELPQTDLVEVHVEGTVFDADQFLVAVQQRPGGSGLGARR